MFFKRQLLPVTDGCRETQDIFDCCCCSVNQSCLTLCNPMDFNTPGLSVPHHLPKVAQVDVHCISDAIHLSHPLTPSFPSAFNLFQHQGLFQWVSCSHQMTKLLAFQPQHQSFQWVFKGWFPLRLTGSILDSENSILWIRLQCRRPQFNSWVGKIHWRRDRLPTPVFLEFPCGSSSKESACNTGDLGSIPGGKNPWRRERLPTPVFWPGEFHGVAKSQTRLSDFHFTILCLQSMSMELLGLLLPVLASLSSPPYQPLPFPAILPNKWPSQLLISGSVTEKARQKPAHSQLKDRKAMQCYRKMSGFGLRRLQMTKFPVLQLIRWQQSLSSSKI